MKNLNRRDFLKISGLGVGATFISGLGLRAFGSNTGGDFYFLQLSDTHWGFEGPKVNPESKTTLRKAIKTINSLEIAPDFIVFTGDLTHTTDDDKERRRRLKEFKEIVSDLKVKNVKFLPGEHDASLDEGQAFKEFFGA